MAIAIYKAATNEVKTFIHEDAVTPPDENTQPFKVPAGYTLVPENELPPGWTREARPVRPTAIEKLRTKAKELLDRQSATEALLRALALTLLDGHNQQQEWLASFKTEVAAATNLADFKTRVAALPNMPQRTAAQLRQAIKDKLDAGAADE